MVKLIVKILLFALICVGTPLAALKLLDIPRYSYKNWETESNLYIMPEDSEVDLLMFGTSHGRVFSRTRNHQRVEKILDRRLLNLSVGSGGGVVPAKMFLSIFYDNNNKTKSVLYFLDPWSVQSEKWNHKNFFPTKEPLTLDFLQRLIDNDVDKTVILNYFRKKFYPEWIFKKASKRKSQDKSLKGIDLGNVDKNLDVLYLEGLNKDAFETYTGILRDFIELSTNNEANVVIIVPPMLLGDLAGTGELMAFLETMKQQYGIEYYDHTNAVPQPEYYFDLHHLNTPGVEYYTETMLKPILADLEQ